MSKNTEYYDQLMEPLKGVRLTKEEHGTQEWIARWDDYTLHSVVSILKKGGLDTGRKKDGYAQPKERKNKNQKSRGRKISPRRLRAKYTLRTNLRFMLRVFRGCAGKNMRKRHRLKGKKIQITRMNGADEK